MRILLIRTDRMGDTLMCLPAIHAIRVQFPQAKITLLLQKNLVSLLEDHPEIDKLLPWDPAEGDGWVAAFRWGRRLRKERFSAALVFNPTRLFHAAAFLARIPVRAGYGRKWGFLLTSSIPDTKSKRNLHETAYNLELAELLGAQTKEPPVYRIPVGPRAQQQAEAIFKSAGVPVSSRPFAIHPWTSNPVKSWPLDSFLELAHRIGREQEPVIIVGGTESAGQISASTQHSASGVIDLTGKIPLSALAAVLSRCRLLVSNDSGPAHVAAAVGTPTLIVAPREHAPVLERWRPWGTAHRILLSPTVNEAVAAAEEAALR